MADNSTGAREYVCDFAVEPILRVGRSDEYDQ